MKTEQVIVERTFNTTATQAWSALTNNDELKKWYFQLEDFKPKLGFKFDFLGGHEEGPKYLHLCEITEIIEGKRIAYTWRYDNYPGITLVAWEVFDKGEQTLVRITHSGLESFKQNGDDFSKENFKGGWNYFIHTALKGYLEPEK